MLNNPKTPSPKPLRTLLGISAAVAALASPSLAQAASITVTATTDETTTNGTCTLREAINEANANNQATSADCAFDETQPFGNDAINLAAVNVDLSIAPGAAPDNNQDGDLDVNPTGGALTIDGAGSGMSSIDGNDLDRVLDLLGTPPSTNPLTVRELTIKDGLTGAQGGGIRATAGTPHVSIEEAVLDSNDAGNAGGGISFAAGSAGASLKIESSTISTNSSSGGIGGGGVAVNGTASKTVNVIDSAITANLQNKMTYPGNAAGLVFNGPANATLSNTDVTLNDNKGQEGGGIFFTASSGSLTVQDGSSINGNFVRDLGNATPGANARGGGIMALAGGSATLTVRDSEVSGNNASVGGGGGINVNSSEPSVRLTVERTTVSGNTAGGGGGIVAYGTSKILNSTITGNNAIDPTDGGGGGIFVGSPTFGANLELRHSTVVDNLGNGNIPSIAPDAIYLFGGAPLETAGSIITDSAGGGVANDSCRGTVTTNRGYNFDDGTSCGFGSAMGSQSSTDAMPSALADNGGLTKTMQLPASSPALDVIPAADCDDLDDGSLAEDQRGFPRPSDGPDADTDPECDAGAYERVTCGGLLAGPGTILGTSADEILDGTTGADLILGAGGNDRIDGGGGNDAICGNSGVDTASFASGGAVVASLAAGTATGQGDDALETIENLTGSPMGDRLTGDGMTNVFSGLDGDDMIFARDGIGDTVDCGAGTDTAQTDRISVDPTTGCESVDATPEPPAPPTSSPAPGAAAQPQSGVAPANPASSTRCKRKKDKPRKCRRKRR